MSFTVNAIQKALKQLGRLNPAHVEGGWDGTTAVSYAAQAADDNQPPHLHGQPAYIEQCTPSVRSILEAEAALSPEQVAAREQAEKEAAAAQAKANAERAESERAEAARVAAAAVATTAATSASVSDAKSAGDTDTDLGDSAGNSDEAGNTDGSTDDADNE